MKLVTTINTLQDKEKQLDKVLEFNNNKVMHLQLKKGASIPEHNAPFNVLVVVRKGKLLFDVSGTKSELTNENFIHLTPLEKHSLEAMEDTDVLVIKIGK
ncbi:hypothetical protein [Bacillus solimangrovi]|uniref:AraC-type arabinose-binding/dimerisation domain-containing protein n=1 Tax=Bacillus solimangrovi TaxID=1305675 RepID=A0A1E5LE51_9BACI|nr:hypothetical protein [Bacillus solimangrovi]OEH92334.1 hypothetical protein BFG57_16290 [Bacillus solimangrovi]